MTAACDDGLGEEELRLCVWGVSNSLSVKHERFLLYSVRHAAQSNSKQPMLTHGDTDYRV